MTVLRDSRKLTDEVWDRLNGSFTSVHGCVKATLEVLAEWGFLELVDMPVDNPVLKDSEIL